MILKVEQGYETFWSSQNNPSAYKACGLLLNVLNSLNKILISPKIQVWLTVFKVDSRCVKNTHTHIRGFFLVLPFAFWEMGRGEEEWGSSQGRLYLSFLHVNVIKKICPHHVLELFRHTFLIKNKFFQNTGIRYFQFFYFSTDSCGLLISVFFSTMTLFC